MSPPALAQWLLTMLVPPGFRDALGGDLAERYARDVPEHGRLRAVMRYWWEVVRARPIALRRSARLVRSTEETVPGRRRVIGLWDDLRSGVRRLASAPVHSALAVLTLAFGVGATTAIWSVVDGVLLRPLPFATPDRLVVMQASTKSDAWYGSSEPEYLDLGSRSDVFAAVAAYTWAEPVLGDTLEPRRITVLTASAELFPVLGVAPVLGRTYTAEEDRRGADAVVVISWALWQQHFGGSSAVLQQSLRLNDLAVPIIGVMPRGFAFPGPAVQAWIPLRLDRANPWARNNHYLETIGRLQRDMTLERARSQLASLAARSEITYPEFYADGGYRVRVRTLREQVVGDVRGALLVLLGAVGLLLTIACVNVANLLLARGEVRRREIAVRAALGARSGRLIRLVLVESTALAVAGGVLGVGLAWTGVQQLPKLAPASVPRVEGVAIDATVLGFSLLLVLLTGLAFGLLPALTAARTPPSDVLEEGGAGRVAGSRRSLLRRGLVAVQLALAVALVLGAGVLIRSFANLYNVDAGILTSRVLTLRLSPSPAQHTDNPDVVRFHDDVRQHIAALPGVVGAGLVSNLPLTGGMNGWSFQIEGRIAATVGDAPAADINQVTPGYFEAMGQPIIRGRAFTAADRADAPPVVIISESLATKYWPGEDPIGRRFRVFAEDWPFMEIVGIVRDVRHYGVDRDAYPAWYVPHAQAYQTAYTSFRPMTLVVRTAAQPSALAGTVRNAVRALDPTVTIENVRTMQDVLNASLGTRRFTLTLIAAFAIVALFLACVGVYGVVAWSVATRRREIGVRMALGARAASVLRSVLGEALVLTSAGLLGGLLLSMVLSAALEGLVFGVRPMDPLTCIAVAVLLAMTAVLAALGPALRATRVDPLAALRPD